MLDLNYKPLEVVDTRGMSNDKWLDYRTTGIGGSDVAAIYEVSGWTTKRALYYSKMKLSKSEPGNPYTLAFGHQVEPFLATWFVDATETCQNCDDGAPVSQKYKAWLERKMGVKIQKIFCYKDTIMYRHPLFPFMQANLDYRIRIITDTGEVKEGIFECKTTSYHIGPEKWGEQFETKVPLEYELQCRHYMSVMNLDFVIIACCWGSTESDYRVRYLQRDLDFEEEIIAHEKDFWENNVLKKSPPPLSLEHSEKELEAFHSYKIADRIKSGEVQEIDNSEKKLNDAIELYLSAMDKKTALEKAAEVQEKQMNIAKLQILECLADKIDESKKSVEFAVKENGDIQTVIKNNRIDKEGFKTNSFREDYPELYKKYSYPISYRVFKVKDVSCQ